MIRFDMIRFDSIDGPTIADIGTQVRD